jgi:hypothetical protein
MKKWIFVSVVVAVAAIAAVAVVWFARQSGGMVPGAVAAVPNVPLSTASASIGQPAAAASGAGNAAAPSVSPLLADPALLATPEAQAWQRREQFNQRARDFFATAAQMSPEAREREAREIDATIDGYESSRQLSAGEAMTLRIGLIQATTDDEVLRADRIAALVARYESDGLRREAQWAVQLRGDPAFTAYKAREQAVVAEVMALAQIPGGITREEYLRQRLQAERVALMQ